MKQLLVTLLIFLFIQVSPQDEVFVQLGISGEAAQDAFISAVVDGDAANTTVSRVFLSAPLSTRIAWVRAVFSWARVYTSGSGFVQKYQKRRRESMPGGKEKPQSINEEMEKQKAEFTKQIKEMRRNLDQLPAETRPEMEKTISEMEKQFKDQFEDPVKRAAMEQVYREIARERTVDEENRLKEFEQRYPADPRQLIRHRLRSFLVLADDVDFKARTKIENGVKKFVDPAYESKSKEWKLLFRAGRAVVDTARTEARAWIIELGEE